ncbi:MAG: hypothetical protein JXR96_30395 [Deltaproteobacteria bacterium]|nr:hypothetical protein [Deltaproteobacteria bacterium]
MRAIVSIALLVGACTSAEPSLVRSRAGQRSEPDSLWAKAVELADRNRSWVAGRMEIRSQVQDGDGKIEQREACSYRNLKAEGGRIRTELQKATRDGKDVTSEKRASEASEKGDLVVRLHSDHPFLPEDQPKVALARTAKTKEIQGRQCIGYEYSLRIDAQTSTSGTAWLDSQTGAPLEIEFSQRPLPPHTDRMRTSIRFELSSAGCWRESGRRTEAEASFFFQTKHLLTEMSFGDYFRSEPTAGRGGSDAGT